ncbi:CACTA en-spm transposon protein [Cucumis melo var. makuwa]|uniref:CACTA en-spm transposon protein n=1 Tax=Cucumis melo var. makuwa TaxID=1194695 RepID=A0A5A7SXI2_CUCMM|nr:CACTA en-spm transposon protein [Cucumis melo var. makuwa]
MTTHLPASGKPFPTPIWYGVGKASRDAFLPTFFPTSFCTSEPSATPTPRRRAQSRLLESECYVAANGKILMTIAPGAEKTISPHAVRFSQAIGVYVRKTFPVCCLKWADVDREYIEVVKADLQSFFVLDFNDQAMNRFVKHQILHIFKEFRGDCHRHFKKYSDPVEACANPPHLLWDVMRIDTTLTNKAARQKHPYNHSSGSKSFLNDNTSSLSKEGSRSIVWSCSGKHMFETECLCHRLQRMHITLISAYTRGYSATLWERDMQDVDVEIVDIGDDLLTTPRRHWKKINPDALLVTCRKSVSQRVPSDGCPDVPFCIEIRFPTSLPLLSTYLCVGSLPASCSA